MEPWFSSSDIACRADLRGVNPGDLASLSGATPEGDASRARAAGAVAPQLSRGRRADCHGTRARGRARVREALR